MSTTADDSLRNSQKQNQNSNDVSGVAPAGGESAADLTVYVQSLLQQMQQRFQTMSSAIIDRSQLK
jgi:hypothetical protein